MAMILLSLSVSVCSQGCRSPYADYAERVGPGAHKLRLIIISHDYYYDFRLGGRARSLSAASLNRTHAPRRQTESGAQYCSGGGASMTDYA